MKNYILTTGLNPNNKTESISVKEDEIKEVLESTIYELDTETNVLFIKILNDIFVTNDAFSGVCFAIGNIEQIEQIEIKEPIECVILVFNTHKEAYETAIIEKQHLDI